MPDDVDVVDDQLPDRRPRGSLQVLPPASLRQELLGVQAARNFRAVAGSDVIERRANGGASYRSDASADYGASCRMPRRMTNKGANPSAT